MSILIKGMEMPKNCGECPFLEATSCEADGRDYKCARTGLYTTPRIKFIRCPLIEVPIVHCCECKYNNHCLTQSFVEEESRVPFDRNTYFCSDGVKEE